MSRTPPYNHKYNFYSRKRREDQVSTLIIKIVAGAELYLELSVANLSTKVITYFYITDNVLLITVSQRGKCVNL